MKPLKLVLIIAAIASLVVLVLEYREIKRHREANRELKMQLAAMTPAATNPPQRARTSDAIKPTAELLQARGQLASLRGQKMEAGKLTEENKKLRAHRYGELLQGNRLKPEEAAPYLQAKLRSAESLLAAYKATGDVTLLREAMNKSPADPRIQFAAFLGLDMSPDEKRASLDAIIRAAPDNALADYLSAREFFKAGQNEQAVKEMVKAAGSPKFDDYALDAMRNAEEVYAAAGFSETESKWLATASASYAYLGMLKGLGKNLTDLADACKKTGDPASAQAATQMAIALGQRLADPSAKGSIMQDLVGLAIERSVLKALNPSAICDSSGRSAQQRLEEINQRTQAIKAAASDDWASDLQSMPEPVQLEYLERLKTSGEMATMTWAKSRQSKP